jgi:AcrR family transcriptional regulator
MRKRGSRNVDFEVSKAAIVERVAEFVVQNPGPHSYRSLAAATGLTTNAVRHYFGDVNSLVAEALRLLHSKAEPMLRRAATEVQGDLAGACNDFCLSIVFGWRAGLGAIHRLGMTYGLTAEGFGPHYLDDVLEPTLLTAEARFARLVADGVMPATDLRAAAISLVSPVLVALMHQDAFGGAKTRPLDVMAFARWHAALVARSLRGEPQATNSSVVQTEAD